MNRARGATWAVVLAVVAATVLAGPAVDGVALTQASQSFGGGDATVADLEVTDGPALETGRFGTGVRYVRGPTARATVRAVDGTPRLVVRVEVPALDVDETATTLLAEGDRGERRLSVPDRSLQRGERSAAVTARTTVRIQSFDVDRTVYERTRTIGGTR